MEAVTLIGILFAWVLLVIATRWFINRCRKRRVSLDRAENILIFVLFGVALVVAFSIN